MVKIFIFFLVLSCVSLFYTLCRVDVSIKAVDPYLYPTAASSTYSCQENTVLISYADGPDVFFKNQNALTASAVNRGFQFIFNFNRYHIDPLFYKAHQFTLTQPTGGGFWLWKPYFILKVMKEFPDNTLIFYADSGVIFTQSIAQLKGLLQSKDMIFVRANQQAPLSQHLKKEAYESLGLTEQSPELRHETIWAFFIAVRNTPKTRFFIESWLKACMNPEALTNSPLNTHNQAKNFKNHLHDQALLSVLVARDPSCSIILSKDELRKKYGVYNFHRHPEQEKASPLLLALGYNRWITQILWNNPLVQWIRDKIGKGVQEAR